MIIREHWYSLINNCTAGGNMAAEKPSAILAAAEAKIQASSSVDLATMQSIKDKKTVLRSKKLFEITGLVPSM